MDIKYHGLFYSIIEQDGIEYQILSTKMAAFMVMESLSHPVVVINEVRVSEGISRTASVIYITVVDYNPNDLQLILDKALAGEYGSRFEIIRREDLPNTDDLGLLVDESNESITYN